MGIYQWEFWDEARSGAKDKDEEEGLQALNCCEAETPHRARYLQHFDEPRVA